MKVLQVVHEFADYVRGEFIKAEAEIEKVLASHPNNVVAVEQPAEAKPATKTD